MEGGNKMGRFGIPELVLILFILLLLFGASKLPEISRSLGQSINEFKKTMIAWANELTRELDNEDIKVAAAPSTNIYTVVSTSEIGRPANGNVAYSISASKFRGYVEGTGWVDFN